MGDTDSTCWTVIRDAAEGSREARETFARWRGTAHLSDLAGVRDEEALADLPEEKRAAWRALWAEVRDLVERHYPN